MVLTVNITSTVVASSSCASTVVNAFEPSLIFVLVALRLTVGLMSLSFTVIWIDEDVPFLPLVTVSISKFRSSSPSSNTSSSAANKYTVFSVVPAGTKIVFSSTSFPSSSEA